MHGQEKGYHKDLLKGVVRRRPQLDLLLDVEDSLDVGDPGGDAVLPPSAPAEDDDSNVDEPIDLEAELEAISMEL